MQKITKTLEEEITERSILKASQKVPVECSTRTLLVQVSRCKKT
jgi:hypothetical protein